MSPKVIRLTEPLEAESSAPSPDRLMSGNPSHSLWNYFTDTSQQFFAGRWSSTRGTWRVRYSENELCVITAGRVVLTDEHGARSAFATGDAFVIPAGFSGTWEVVEDCTKIYAIFEARA
jgi:uncharacterized cupin superfamily protein